MNAAERAQLDQWRAYIRASLETLPRRAIDDRAFCAGVSFALSMAVRGRDTFALADAWQELMADRHRV